MEEADFAGPEEAESVAPVEQPAPTPSPTVEAAQIVPAPAPAPALANVGPSAALAAAEGAVIAGQADVAAAVAQGPSPVVVAPPPGLGGAAVDPAKPEEPKVPEPEPEILPLETDSDAWLDLLRDGYLRQLREENEYLEPPPFHRAIHYAAEPGGPCPPGKYPKNALNVQLQMLLKNRTGGELMLGNLTKPAVVVPPQKGGKGALAAVAPLLGQSGGLTQLINQMNTGLIDGKPVNMATKGQLLIAAAKTLAEAKAKGADKGKGKGKVKGYKPY